MNHTKSFIVIFSTLMLFGSCSQPTVTTRDEDKTVSTKAENLENFQVRVLNFHTTNRCQLCLTIERMVKETVLSEYAEQVENGQLKLFVLSVQQSENRKIAEEYFAYGSALFISSGVGENSQVSDITNEAFLYAEANPDRFLETLRTAINQHLE